MRSNRRSVARYCLRFGKMSKIGKKPINIPDGVEIKINGGFISIKGPKGMLEKKIPLLLTISTSDGKIVVTPAETAPGRDDKQNMAFWGLYRALIQNMITGVTSGFSKSLELNGVGYKAVQKGNDLEISLGFSHVIPYKAPDGITFKIEKNVITVSGIDRELVGFVAAQIRSLKVPDPYKVHGVKYVGEFIKTKAGKKAVATA